MLPYIPLPFWPHHLNAFGLMLWLAAVAGAIIADRAFKRAHVEVNGELADAVGMVAVALVMGIIGSKVWHVLDTPSEFREIGWRVLWDNAGFAWSRGGDWLWRRADWVFSFRGRLLRDRDPAGSYLWNHISSVGNGISEW